MEVIRSELVILVWMNTVILTDGYGQITIVLSSVARCCRNRNLLGKS